MESFSVFRIFLESFKHRNKRLELRRLSLHADILKERCTDSGISIDHVMQADFLLYLAEAIQAIKEDRRNEWWPETLLFKSFRGGSFEIFLRSESTAYFNRLAHVLDIQRLDDLQPFVEGLTTSAIYTPKWDMERISPLKLMNYEGLCGRE